MNCKVCNSNNLEIIGAEEKYYYCNNCEAIFIEEEEIVAPEEEKERYEGHDNNHQNEGYVQMFRDFINEVVTPYIDLSNNFSVINFCFFSSLVFI